jgi:hypothetical protein
VPVENSGVRGHLHDVPASKWSAAILEHSFAISIPIQILQVHDKTRGVCAKIIYFRTCAAGRRLLACRSERSGG